MECACICSYDAELPEFHLARMLRARKQHTCCECGETIEPGTYYEQVTGKWDGWIGTFKTCELCVRIREDWCCTWEYGDLRNALWECLGFDYVTGECDDD